MNVSFQGFEERLATFEAGSGVKAGLPVKITANGTVAPCGAADIPCGVAVNVRGGFAGVQLRGYTRLPFTGSLALGRQVIVADAGGKIKAGTGSTGLPVLVTDLDSADGVAGLIL